MPDSSHEKAAAKGPDDDSRVAWLPDLLYTQGRFERGLALVCDSAGRISAIARATEVDAHMIRPLRNRALLPGLVNAHSHAFQRVIRGRTEYRTSAAQDSFWTWREMMYSAAMRLGPEEIYDASRMAFLEMVMGGITSVGEFHYLHHTPDGAAYDDPNLLAKQVVRAARGVGLRIALLRVAYARSGHRTAPNPRQSRFIEADPEAYLSNVDALQAALARDDVETAWVGVAPHSVRAVPRAYLKEVFRFALGRGLPVHMHIAEQPAEVSACMEEYGLRPVALLATEGLLSNRFTGVHAIHVTPEEAQALARSGAMVCACPTTERNLGDGVVPADLFFREGVRVALGTDSHTQIDLLEDARQLELNLRLQKLERAVLAREGDSLHSLATRLFECATVHGAQSIGASCGKIEPGRPADFFTVDLDDPTIAGASTDDLLPCIVFSLAPPSVREVFVGGRPLLEGGEHRDRLEIVQRFAALQRRLWS
ncbi:MAG TPA: formimidoylglutamate deiminase [Pyrinomonadaceae bacterium]|jgi:formimidoylglutamate deiminase|nr:formimidoylglutamate deiminase [Pyrinomonadaceae bacterium]